jgi:rhodanese-related sulfurtransferase
MAGIFVSMIILIISPRAFAGDRDLADRIDKIMSECREHSDYHISAVKLNKWMQEGKTDFLVLDLRFAPEDGAWGQPKYGRIPGSLHIPYYDLFKAENLARLPKDKKLILVGHMGVHENFSVVPLRLLGYDAYSLLLGMSGWQKDYPAVGHINMLLNAADKMDFPLEKETEGHMMDQEHMKHMK